MGREVGARSDRGVARESLTTGFNRAHALDS